MNDRQLFRKLLLHFAIGATLGGIFSGVLLILNIQHVLDVVQSSVAPKTTMTTAALDFLITNLRFFAA